MEVSDLANAIRQSCITIIRMSNYLSCIVLTAKHLMFGSPLLLHFSLSFIACSPFHCSSTYTASSSLIHFRNITN